MDKKPSNTKPFPIKKRPASLQSKWVGYVVLGFGLLAFVTVLMFAWQMYFRSESIEQRVAADTNAAREAEAGVLAGVIRQSSQDQAQKNKKKRQTKALDARLIKGLWKTQLAYGTAVIEIKDDFYKIIISFENRSFPRRYSFGTYQVEGGRLIMKPDRSIQPPRGTKTVTYMPVTVIPFSVDASVREGYMIWQVPDNANPKNHAFLSLASDNAAIWSPHK